MDHFLVRIRIQLFFSMRIRIQQLKKRRIRPNKICNKLLYEVLNRQELKKDCSKVTMKVCPHLVKPFHFIPSKKNSLLFEKISENELFSFRLRNRKKSLNEMREKGNSSLYATNFSLKTQIIKWSIFIKKFKMGLFCWSRSSGLFCSGSGLFCVS